MNKSQNASSFAELSKLSVEPSPRWVRVKAGHETLADSRETQLLLQYGPRSLPTYFFPTKAVQMARLANPQDQEEKRFWDVVVPGQHLERAAWSFISPPEQLAALAEHISFTWQHESITWFEEEETVFAHARDPYKRVDALSSSRQVQVQVDGRIIAESRRPTLLFETYLPTRYYIPAPDVNMDYLLPSNTRSACPYKGWANYWSIKVGDKLLTDVVWSYPEPIPENPKIKGLFAFFNEKVDVVVDGVLQERPRTPWS
jgi:uncharacterized protein (DUF427 family)